MSQQQKNKRSAGTAGMKALLASASVAATLAGWAMLPSNDPQQAAANAQPGVLTAPAAPSTPANGQEDIAPQLQLPEVTLPMPPSTGEDSPQFPAPNSQARRPAPFTNSHSSR